MCVVAVVAGVVVVYAVYAEVADPCLLQRMLCVVCAVYVHVVAVRIVVVGEGCYCRLLVYGVAEC